MSKKPLGPGPGAYGLPPAVGFVDHDVRKKRLPQYSFRAQTKIIDKRVSPGPGAYKVEGITRYGYTNAHQYTMGALTPIPEKSKGPGPADHDVHKKPHLKGSNAPAFTMVGKNNYRFKEYTPGPNVYMFGMESTKPSVPAYTMGILKPIEVQTRSPGPAAYGQVDLNYKLRRSPVYSMTGKNNFEFKNISPGSNAYNLVEHKPGKKGAAYTFGLRHSEYAPPMIVDCDN